MTLRIGLMGFGRIGRNLFRMLYTRDDIEIVGISDTADVKSLVYLLRYDTLLGRFPDVVSLVDGHLYVRGKQIKMLAGKEPGDVPWGELGADIVVEAASHQRSRAEAQKHIDAGAKRVIMCVQPTDEPDITVVMGINHHEVKPEHKVISNGSITAHCAAPLVKVLDRAFGADKIFVASVHAYTSEQRLADVPAADPRRSRAATENIVPADTNAARTLMRLFPALDGKMTAMALNVPVSNGSMVDLTFFTKKPVTVAAVNEVVRTAVAAEFPTTVDYCNDPIVSSDVKQTPFSCTYDSLATQVLGDHMFKVIAWYDNGWAYAMRAVELMEYISKMPYAASGKRS